MKLNQKKIAQMAAGVFRGRKRYGEHLMLHPVREWSLGVALFLLILLGGAWWAATVYLRYVDVSTLVGANTGNGLVTYRGAQVAEAISVLDARATEYRTLIAAYSGGGSVPEVVVTPSETTATSSPDSAIPPKPAASSTDVVAAPVEEDKSAAATEADAASATETTEPTSTTPQLAE